MGVAKVVYRPEGKKNWPDPDVVQDVNLNEKEFDDKATIDGEPVRIARRMTGPRKYVKGVVNILSEEHVAALLRLPDCPFERIKDQPKAKKGPPAKVEKSKEVAAPKKAGGGGEK